MDTKAARTFIDARWEESIIPQLCDYIRIPNKSPYFDPDWESKPHMDAAAELMRAWCVTEPIDGMKVEVVKLEARTPLLFVEVPASPNYEGDCCVLLYGHFDKQPEFSGWEEGLSPWEPVLRDGKLYGRGGADDGYAVFGSLTAIRALQEQGIPHARCVLVIEGCEESGSFDLPHYIEHLRDRIGSPDLVVCLDAESGNYDQLWCTTNLRGNLVGNLRVEVLTEGVHSGSASGVVVESFRVLRQLLDRVEDSVTGESKVSALNTVIPDYRIKEAEAAAVVLDYPSFQAKYPFVGTGHPITDDATQLILNNHWRSSLCVTGVDGIPAMQDAGNTLRPFTDAKLSFRLPPNCNPEDAEKEIKALLEADPPYGTKVSFDVALPNRGWEAPKIADWLHESMEIGSTAFFDGRSVVYTGTGGSIPFMGMLGDMFPEAQFLVTGLLGPYSNAHGPNEFMHIQCAKNLTGCVAQVLETHAAR
jgi:acetylornithine deacetylase/succinyl-diaminopimelate desuccinylase-like protein